MSCHRFVLTVAALPVLVCGCALPAQLAPPWTYARLANRDAVVRYLLPYGLRLDTPLEYDKPATTVEDALARVSAHLASDGKLRSAEGKEIFFDRVRSGGPPPMPLSAEAAAAEAQRWREMAERYTIIRILEFGC